MTIARTAWRRLGWLGTAAAAFLLATFLGYALLHFGNVERTYDLAGQFATAQDIEAYRARRGYDRGLLGGYLAYLGALIRFDSPRSELTGEPVLGQLRRTVPVTLAALLPGFLIGHLLALALAGAAAYAPGGRIDGAVQLVGALLLSTAGALVVILVQFSLSSSLGLDWLPVRGWRTDTLSDYLESVAAPTITLVLIVLGHALRFDRGALVEEMGRPWIDALRGLGCSRLRCLLAHALPNAAPVLLVRILFSLPGVAIGGSFLIESHFGIPGMGQLTLEAIQGGDRTFLLTLIGIAAMAFATTQALSDALSARIDPRRRLVL